jgi:fructokinase
LIVVCGEALVDLVPRAGDGLHLARPGGSPANVAVGLGRLGLDVCLIARLSEDHFGRLIRHHLVGSGVDLSLAVNTPQRCTVALVRLDRSGDAAYDFFISGGADDGWRPAELPAALPAGALHVSCALALAKPSIGDTVEFLLTRERGRRVISVDPNPRPALITDAAAARARLARWIGLAHLVRASGEDLAWIHPRQAVHDVARDWRRLGPALVVVTRGRDGVYALGPAGEIELGGPPVDAVDTVGAGDAFTAGLLAALQRAGRLSPSGLRSLPADVLAEVLGYAQRVAALTCTRVGADPPWRHEVEPVLASDRLRTSRSAGKLAGVGMMSRDEAMRFLAEGTRTGKLATASPSGRPHVAPIWFVIDGTDLVFTTGRDTVKGRNLRANPRAALTVDVDRFPYDFALVRGPVTLYDDLDDMLHWATRIAARYVPPGRAEEYGRRNAVPEELLCRLRVEQITGIRDIAL